MADKLGGNAIKSNTIPANRAVNNSLSYSNFDSQVKAFVDGGGRPSIKNIRYFGANTTANINGNQTITISGANFNQNVQVYVNGSAVPVVSRINANSVSFTTAAQTAGTYPVYAINPDGGFAILIPGIVYA